MLAFFNRIIDWFKSLFWKEEMELTLVGLQNSGKTTFVNVIAVSSIDSKYSPLPINQRYSSVTVCVCVVCVFYMQSGQFNEDMIPTVGFNMRKVTKGNVTIKVGPTTGAYAYSLIFSHFSCILMVYMSHYGQYTLSTGPARQCGIITQQSSHIILLYMYV